MRRLIQEHHSSFTRITRYLVCPPREQLEKPLPVLLALHGQGMSAEKFLRILLPLETVEMIVVIPEGIYPFEIRKEHALHIGYGWYLYRGDQDQFHEHLLTSEGYLLELLDQVAKLYPVERQRSVILGYSQGGYLAGFMALRQRQRFNGLIIASARLKHEFLHNELAAGDLPDTLFLHSEQDLATPWPRAEEGMQLLQQAGAQVDRFLHSAGHRLPEDALQFAEQWLQRKGFDAATPP